MSEKSTNAQFAESLRIAADLVASSRASGEMPKLAESMRRAADTIELLEAQLAAYEDAEEQGMPVRLPCKVGDTVYEFDYEFYQESPKCETCGHFQECSRNTQDNEFSTRPFPLECRVVVETQATARLILYWIENALFGKTVFLTREEAEAALRKRKGGGEDA